jgi:AcrR family transcriptional regulator
VTNSAASNGNRTRRGEARRREILDAAREVFSTRGFEQASMAEIAAKVGVVEGALYKHFGSKRELLFETTRAFYEPLIAATARELATIHGTRNRLRYVIQRHLQSFVDHPALCRLIMHEIRPYSDYFDSVVRELNRKTTSQVVTILEEARLAGELRADVRPALVRDVIFGGIEHVAWKALAGRGTLDASAVAEELTELVLRGVRADGPSATTQDAELQRLRAQIDRLAGLVDTALAKKARKRPERTTKGRTS